jgi:Helix-turn-helix domain
MVHGRPGPAPETTKREQFARLIGRGVPNADERVCIADLERQARGVRAIGVELGRDPATISRELRRNRDPVSGEYRSFTAQRIAAGRRARPGRGKLVGDPVLRQWVGARPVGEAVEPGADHPPAALRVPRRAGAARGARDDLPGDLPPGAGRAAPGPASRCCAPAGGAASRTVARTPLGPVPGWT